VVFSNWLREREIKKVLRTLARARVLSFSQIRNAWIVDLLVEGEEALRTCHMRGWIEPMPHGAISDTEATTERVALRLTDSGWNAIHGTHAWVICTFLVALVRLFATVVGIILKR
jgi:hypothetical protein